MSTTETPGPNGGSEPDSPVTDVPATPPVHLRLGGPAHATEPFSRVSSTSRPSASEDSADPTEDAKIDEQGGPDDEEYVAGDEDYGTDYPDYPDYPDYADYTAGDEPVIPPLAEADGVAGAEEAGPAEADELTSGPAVYGYPPEAQPLTSGSVVASVRTGRAGRSRPAHDDLVGSPWQRSYAAWQRAGVDWQPVEAGPVETDLVERDQDSVPEIEQAPAPDIDPDIGAASPVPAEPAAPAPRALPLSRQDGRRVPSRGGRRAGVITAVAVLMAVGVASGAYALFDDEEPGAGGPPAKLGDSVFVTDPAATTDGRVQELRDVAAVGATIAAVGAEIGGDYSRGQFLVSGDGGRGWQVAKVRTADDGEPPPGEYPERVSGGPGGWIALGGSASQRVVWTSADARTWTRQPNAAAVGFQRGDQVNELTRTGAGYVAVGASRPEASGGASAQTVAWTSPDGRAWRRLTAAQFRTPRGRRVARLEHVAALGGTVVTQGTSIRTVGKAGTRDERRRKGKRVREREGFWRSTDGGGSWTPVTVPQALGSYGTVDGVVSGPNGFFTVREARRPPRQGRRKRPESYAVVMRSVDGAKWWPAGRVRVPGYTLLDRLAGSEHGLAALATIRGGRTLVLRSRDGASWREAGEIPRRDRRTLTGATVTPTATVVTGRQGVGEETGAFLAAVGGAGPVDLGLVPDAVHAERAVTEVAAYGGQSVAVGSTNGDAAVWASRDGATWTRGNAADGGFTGAGQQRLHDVVRGGPGWLAVGTSGDSGRRPLAVTSTDAQSWSQAGQASAFDPRGGELLAYGAAYGRRGYIVVGERIAKGRAAAVAWQSLDLRTWRPAAGVGRAGTAMRDVAAWRGGYVAVGTREVDKTARPAVWISTDGKKWTSATAPALAAGGFDTVVASGDRLLATGWQADPGNRGGGSAVAAVSADGGRSWQLRPLPGGGRNAELTAATATPRGFVVAVTAGGGRDEISLWSSPDGNAWRSRSPRGAGLSGPGWRRFTGLASYGGTLLGVGFTGDHRRDLPLLWQGPLS